MGLALGGPLGSLGHLKTKSATESLEAKAFSRLQPPSAQGLDTDD